MPAIFGSTPCALAATFDESPFDSRRTLSMCESMSAAPAAPAVPAAPAAPAGLVSRRAGGRRLLLGPRERCMTCESRSARSRLAGPTSNSKSSMCMVLLSSSIGLVV
jgi:hypothetical protein